MSRRIMVVDSDQRGFQIDASAARRFLDDALVVVVLASYTGDLADATVLRPVAGRRADELRMLAGTSALSLMQTFR